MEQHIVLQQKGTEKLFMTDIEALDLIMVKAKLQDKEEGQGWTQYQCDETEAEYKKFLALKRRYPEKEIVPNSLIDKFWHQHILDTYKYAQDCENIFGYFLHHYPYFGMNGIKDAQNLADAFDETKRIYFLHFKEEYIGEAMRCQAPKCRTQCKPMKCK
jgi:hypothetical protein